MHFNNNPRRISSSETITDGASLAIPVLINDRRQAVVVCYDNDPLTFKESTKHKLINLVRIASLSIQTSVKKSETVSELFTQNFGAYMAELWELSLNLELDRIKKGNTETTWVGFISPEDVSGLRTKYRLEDLQKIQTDFVTALNPSVYGIPGYMGYNSDYVYTFVIQSDDQDAVAKWIDKVKAKFEYGLKLSIGGSIRAEFKAGFTKLTSDTASTYQAVDRAKKALNNVMNDSEAEVAEV